MVTYKNKIYVFGGYTSKWMNDMYALDLQTNEWNQVIQNGHIPNKRSGHSAVLYDEHKMLIYGGFDGDQDDYLNDLNSFDFETNTWTQIAKACIRDDLTGITKREGFSYAYLESSKSFLVYGGYARKPLGDIWLLDVATWDWTKIDPPASFQLHARNNHRMIVMNENKVILYGGDGGNGTLGSGEGHSLQEMIYYDAETKLMHQVESLDRSTEPEARNAHVFVSLVCGSEMKGLLFGGSNGRKSLNDAHLCEVSFSSSSHAKVQWRPLRTGLGAVPSGREASAYAVANRSLYVFGGCVSGNYDKELWQLSADTAGAEMPPPDLRRRSAACTVM